MAGERFPVIGVARHRMATDGQGVTTLVAAYGCPLRCRMCLNPQSWRPGTPVQRLTAPELYDRVKLDDLYFQATNGGVTLGGGEPLLYAPFIREFRALCGERWRLTAETCLNLPAEEVRTAMTCVDAFIVDVKELDPGIYRRYTGADNQRMADNLRMLLDGVGPERVTVRVPHIPGWNTPADVERSVQALRRMGATRLDVFSYQRRLV